ncbi:hypothetical protein FRACYDRAFT_259431 [Fragilariopsis cylindrus CCMP1102]|uniref:Uncharacterized protein n=1 Tax=Fragilariopsis cylindrus CCMP1102 TaxID=635003 RepID=A0A1E7FZN3_9STRA|nr:hypothetical protein FRACYDRAFT_259431 [Fragilariopsis cylindrus CCMP1102]|eukprot:OEU23610.1 hypothetical protein FRACYDRAFT_259431 [Fragilariopsis cylindrus CCMP1102]
MQQHPPPQRPTFCNSNSFDQQRRQQQQQSSYSTMIPRDTTTSAAQHRSSSHFGTMTTLTAPTQDHPCIDYYVEPKRHDGSFDYHSQNHDAHQGRNNHRNEYQQVNRGQDDQRDPYNSTNTMRRRYGHHPVAIPEDEGKYNDNTREQQRRQQNKTIFDKFKPYLCFFGVTMIGMFAYYVWTVVIPYIFQVVFPMVFNLLCISFACSIVACMGWLLYSRTVTASAITSATFSSDITGSVTTTNKENQIETSGDQIETQRSGSGSGS